jgi:hypothetical protein
MDGCERGVYRQRCFNGLVEYFIYDSNCQLIAKIEVLAGYADDQTEDAMKLWLDERDPIDSGEPLTAPFSLPALAPSPSVQAA